MDSSDDNDELLYGQYIRIERFLADQAADCAIIEGAESSGIGGEQAQAARLRQETAAVQLRLALRKMTQIVPRTKRGSLAMNRALQLCFKHHLSEDGDVMELVKFHMLHLDKFLDESGELASSKLVMNLSWVDVTSDQK